MSMLRAVEQESRAQLRAEKAYAARGRRLGLNVGKTMRPRGQRGTWRDGGSPC